jgi:hypothetical protein
LARHPEEAATASVDWAAVRSRRPSPE